MVQLSGLKFVSALLALVTPSIAVGVAPGQIKNLVTFGDSYTDASYYPSAAGGYQWPTWAAMYGPFNLFGFAKSGATCSNYLTYRPFPPIQESQLPLYFNQTYNGTLRLNPHETIYTIWIGTNDLGVNSLLTGTPMEGVSIVPVRQCVIDVVKRLYDGGARNFILQNIIPLDLTILYSPNSYPSRYWTAQRNTTEWAVFMRELVRSGNRITDLELQALVPSLAGAHVATFDSYGLFTDMYNNPGNYLNGSVPFNVTGAIKSCVYTQDESTKDAGTCTTVTDEKAQDSYLWYDELHPSVQAGRVIAREITNVATGKWSPWATWLS